MYPPQLTISVISSFLLHPNCPARVGQHASSSSCIPPYTKMEGDLNVSTNEVLVWVTILFCAPASSHDRKIFGPHRSRKSERGIEKDLVLGC
ncbi:hypothetical protein F5Y10DRAFT_140781 [Nemania abortiva]|nr:hypothetical protein F5Y10DRAFT_140781 [Nemania abortiva]